MHVGIISLGCAKNLVDSELVLGMLVANGYQIVTRGEDAEVIIINTCGFIQPAKEEAINTIFQTIKEKVAGQRIIVIGCLVERYKSILEKEIPEIDGFISISEYPNFGKRLTKILKTKHQVVPLSYNHRIVSTPAYWAYVKIAEGCSNHCAYCAIPLIRGEYHSRSIATIYSEVEQLVQAGKKEIVLIAQDTTRFGLDRHESIEELLTKLASIKDLKMLRLLYLYPDDVTKELVQVIKQHPVIAPYFDIPMQHGSNKMLKLMNRRGSKESCLELMNYIRSEIPHAVFRTTLMVGFNQETDEDFAQLLDLVNKGQFDRLGVFKYSKEDETPAYNLTDDIEESVKEQRYAKVIEIQKHIAYRKGKQRIGQIQQVLIRGYDEKLHMYVGRSYAFAPDEVDGYVYVKTTKTLKPGDYVAVKIIDSMIYDLIGEEII